MHRLTLLSAVLLLLVSACTTVEYPLHLTPADRDKLREWAPAFTVLCAGEQLRECR